MSASSSIAVFAYDFPHQKTRDFLSCLAFSGFKNVEVIAAPWKNLKSSTTQSELFETTNFKDDLDPFLIHSTREICESFCFNYHCIPHNDFESIKRVVRGKNISLGIISGARIISEEVIKLFDEGIVNFHPGKIPETSGLDSFYYTITKDVELGVTAHFIDSRVDAGDFLFFEKTDIFLSNSLDAVRYNSYQTQIKALSKFLDSYKANTLERNPISRPFKNSPMTSLDKFKALADFPKWRAKQSLHIAGEAFLNSCRMNNLTEIEQSLKINRELINYRSPQGWTPLIVACFHQSNRAVSFLIGEGADPNLSGLNGTTPLMYAKTKSKNLGTDFQDIFKSLLDAGANPFQCDKHGKDLLYYLSHNEFAHVKSWLKEYLER